MAIERDIHALLYDHDCVIVPGFGGLLTHRRPARLDAARRLIHSPAKDLSFNRQLTRNDGLLADRVAHRLGLPHDGAIATIEEEVRSWTDRMTRNGRVEINGIGTFFRDGERNVQFEPDRHQNHLKDSYGLRPVAAVPIVKARPVIQPKVIALKPLVDAEGRNERRAPLLWAAAITTGVLFSAAAWWAVEDDALISAHRGAFGLFAPSAPASYRARAVLPAAMELPDETNWSAPDQLFGVHPFPIAGANGPLVMVDLGVAPSEPHPPIPPPATPSTDAVADKTHVAVAAVRTGRYHVIGGCFSVEANADRFLATLRGKGFDAVLIDQHRGLYRVAFGTYPDRSTALEAMAAVRQQEGADAWLLVK